MTLGKHLCPDENIGRALPGLVEGIEHGAFALRAVAVDSRDAAVGEARSQRLLEALGSFSERPDVCTAAGALFDERAGVAAMVAAQFAATGVYGQARVAAIAACDVPAARTDQRRREPTTVQEHQGLSAGIEVPPNGLGERLADAVGGGASERIDEA